MMLRALLPPAMLATALLLASCVETSFDSATSGTLRITTDNLPAGRVGASYSATLEAEGGRPPYTWSVASGTLPDGLTFDTDTGEILGTPTTIQVENVSFTATDADGRRDSRAFQITVSSVPATFPRLFVACAGSAPGVKIWNNADALSADRAPDATLGGLTGDPLALALHGDRLFVASDDAAHPLAIFDAVSLAGDGTAPDHRLPVSAFGGSALATVYDLFVGPAGHLWVCDGYVRLFLDASNLDASSDSQARFTHPWGAQIHAAAYDATGGKLLGGQVSGAGAIVWDDPVSQSGETHPPDWQLYAFGPPTRMTIAGDRLYASSLNDSPGGFINIWDDISTVSSSTIPDVTMGFPSDLDSTVHVQVLDDTLVATVSNAPFVYQVNLYKNAASITGETAADFEISDAAMNLPEKTALASSGRLYVLDADGVLLFDDALASPAFVAEIQTGVSAPNDFLLLE